MTISPENAASHIGAALDRQRQAFARAGHVSAETRIDRIDRVINLIYDNQDRLAAALNSDFGNRSPHQSRMSDIYATIEGLKFNRKHLRRWMRPEKRKAPFPMNLLGARARIEYQPKGVVGIIGTWNFPVNTVLSPLAGVFAAGNRAMIKFSEITPATGELLEQLIAEYFNEDELVGINGGPEVGASFASQPFDHIIFTGATGIARHILHGAADNLTPVTLELGGKSPVIVSRSANLRESALRIMAGKALNAGQVCLSPDYILVPRESRDELIRHMADDIAAMFPTMLDNPDYTSVVNERHYRRLQSYLEDARDKNADIREQNPAGEDFSRQNGTHKIPFTFVVEPTDDMLVMQEELFGPLLCIRSYERLDECIDYINRNPRPLALYYFGTDKDEERRLLDHTLSGAVTVNDVLFHVSCEDLPFGGIGHSGMGHYHGIDGFRTFSHARAVFHQSKINFQKLGGMLPPYGSRADKTLDAMIKK